MDEHHLAAGQHLLVDRRPEHREHGVEAALVDRCEVAVAGVDQLVAAGLGGIGRGRIRQQRPDVVAVGVEPAELPRPQARVAVAADVRHHLDVQVAVVVHGYALHRLAIGHAGRLADVRAAADQPAQSCPHARADADAERPARGLLAEVIPAVPEKLLLQGALRQRRRGAGAEHPRRQVPHDLPSGIDDGHLDVRGGRHREGDDGTLVIPHGLRTGGEADVGRAGRGTGHQAGCRADERQRDRQAREAIHHYAFRKGRGRSRARGPRCIVKADHRRTAVDAVGHVESTVGHGEVTADRPGERCLRVAGPAAGSGFIRGSPCSPRLSDWANTSLRYATPRRSPRATSRPPDVTPPR